MGLLHGARFARFDLLQAINHLAKSMTMVGWVGNEAHQLQPHPFTDVDSAGCPKTQRGMSIQHTTIGEPATYLQAGALTR